MKKFWCFLCVLQELSPDIGCKKAQIGPKWGQGHMGGQNYMFISYECKTLFTELKNLYSFSRYFDVSEI